MQSNGNGNENGSRGPGAEFKELIDAVLRSKPQEKSPVEKLSTAINTLSGVIVTSFFLPFLIVFAYNGLQPAAWPDISYLPTVAGLVVFRILVHMIRKE